MNYNLLPDDALLRAEDIHRPRGPVPLGRSAWWSAVRRGDAPAAVHVGPRVTAWRWADVRAYLQRLSARG